MLAGFRERVRRLSVIWNSLTSLVAQIDHQRLGVQSEVSEDVNRVDAVIVIHEAHPIHQT